MARFKFGSRRATTTIDVVHTYPSGATHKVCVSYSRELLPGDDPRDPTGEIREVWINGIDGYEKRMNDDRRDTCIGYSKDLQNGDNVKWLAKSVQRDSRGKPSGLMGSVLDALKKEPIGV